MATSVDDILPGVLNPRESAKWIVENTDANLICLDEDAIGRAAKLICASSPAQLKQLDFSECEIQPKTADRAAVDWIFFVDSINFSFWFDPGESSHFEVTHNGKKYSGYFACCAAVNRALEEGIPLTSADWMAQTDGQQLAQIFRSDDGSTIPMLDQRVEVLRQNGQILLEKFNGSFYNCILQCSQSAQGLLRLIVENFPNFRDFAEYKGSKVSFLKRAQILVADLYNCLNRSDPTAQFPDIDSLTMFADYRVPQALAFMGVLKYGPDLICRLTNPDHLLKTGSEMEVQLRGFSIAACDRILDKIREMCPALIGTAVYDRLREFNAADVDVWLWLWRRENAEEIEKSITFHRCRSIYY